MRFTWIAAVCAAAALSGCATFQHYIPSKVSFTADSGGMAHVPTLRKFGIRYGATNSIQTPVYCDAATLTQCSTTSNPGTGSEGDPAWLAFGKLNSWGSQLGLFATNSTNEVLGTGSTGIVGLESLSSAGIASYTGTITATHCAEWSSSGVLEDAGAACGSGSGAVSSVSGDGALITNSASTGAVTLSLGTAVAYGVWGNDTSATATPSYVALSSWPLAAFPSGLAQLATAQTFSAATTFSAGLVFSGLSSGTQVSCLGLDASNNVVLLSGACGSASMVYPGAGIPNSTGSAWGTSYSVSGSGSVALTTSPVLTLPTLTGYATASLPTCSSTTNLYALAVTTDGTPSLSFCNGTEWVSNGGTTFTMSGTGCTPTAATGDATGGSFTLATGPCTSVTITFNGAVGMTATHLWVCTAYDETLQAAGTFFGTWGSTPSATPTTSAVIPIPAAAGATDTIYFSCGPH